MQKMWHLNNMRTFLTRTKALYIVNKHPCCIFVMEYNTQGNFGKYYDPQCFLCIITFSSTFYIFDFYHIRLCITHTIFTHTCSILRIFLQCGTEKISWGDEKINKFISRLWSDKIDTSFVRSLTSDFISVFILEKEEMHNVKQIFSFYIVVRVLFKMVIFAKNMTVG